MISASPQQRRDWAAAADKFRGKRGGKELIDAETAWDHQLWPINEEHPDSELVWYYLDSTMCDADGNRVEHGRFSTNMMRAFYEQPAPGIWMVRHEDWATHRPASEVEQIACGDLLRKEIEKTNIEKVTRIEKLTTEQIIGEHQATAIEKLTTEPTPKQILDPIPENEEYRTRHEMKKDRDWYKRFLAEEGLSDETSSESPMSSATPSPAGSEPDEELTTGHIVGHLTTEQIAGELHATELQATEIETLTAEQIAGEHQATAIEKLTTEQITGEHQAMVIEKLTAEQIAGELHATELQATKIETLTTEQIAGEHQATAIEKLATEQIAAELQT